MAEHFNLKTSFFVSRKQCRCHVISLRINKFMKWNVFINLEKEIDVFAEHRLFVKKKKLKKCSNDRMDYFFYI